MFVVKSNFMSDFKLGDNINYNLKILSKLYSNQSQCPENEKEVLCKPIIVFIAAICEAVLLDFHNRLQHYTFEGVKNITQSILNYVRNKKIDEFEKYIASAKKHDLFAAKETNYYEDLDTVRKLRNLIHIQNAKNHFDRDEKKTFTFSRQLQAEKTLEITLKTLSARYPRESHLHHVTDFVCPWMEHFVGVAK
jgi:hypothetical protein